MDIAGLRILVDVARHGSFAAAARQHDLDPSSVSRAIAVLEQGLGIRLFQRSTRRLSLTEAGQTYLARVEAVVAELDRARDEAQAVSAAPSGLLRLTASVAFGQVCIVPLLGRLHADFPALRLELLLSDANLDLVGEGIDLAVRLAPEVSVDLVRARLMETRYRVCAASSYLQGAPRLAQPADLAAHRCVLFTLPGFRSRWLFRDADGAIVEVPVAGDVTISNALALRDAALAGLGPALLADWLVDRELAAGRLVDVFPDHRVTATTFDTAAWLVYPSRSFLPHKVRAAVDFLRRHLPGGLPAPGGNAG